MRSLNEYLKIVSREYRIERILSSGRNLSILVQDGDNRYVIKILNSNIEYVYELCTKIRSILKTSTQCRILDFNNFKALIRPYYPYTLRDIYNGNSISNREIVKQYLRKILELLYKLTSYGLVYTDLKPENIGIDDDGNIHIVDFEGLTHVYSKPQSFTYEYIVPEYIYLNTVFRESNTYHYALLLYEGFTGSKCNPLIHGYCRERNLSREVLLLLHRMFIFSPLYRPSLTSIYRDLMDILVE